MSVPLFPEQCASCKHFDGILAEDYEDNVEHDVKMKCLAFPNGIPEAILDGSFDHTKEYPGDHGIQFELNEAV